MALRVCVAGATGWAGGALARAIARTDDLTLVAGGLTAARRPPPRRRPGRLLPERAAQFLCRRCTCHGVRRFR